MHPQKSAFNNKETKSSELVKKGKNIGAKSGSTAVKALKTLGKFVWSAPAIESALFLESKTAGTDRFGRALDTPDGYKKALKDDEFSKYYLKHGSFPTAIASDTVNEGAVMHQIESKIRQNRMAQLIRGEAGNREATPEQLELEKEHNDFLSQYGSQHGDENANNPIQSIFDL
tara:strand:- start:4275 stop:4793 length:519 start_codon:yes stop_codon:yes gene_type:complete